MMHKKPNLFCSFLQQQKRWSNYPLHSSDSTLHLLTTILADSGQNYPYIVHVFTWSAQIMRENIFFLILVVESYTKVCHFSLCNRSSNCLFPSCFHSNHQNSGQGSPSCLVFYNRFLTSPFLSLSPILFQSIRYILYSYSSMLQTIVQLYNIDCKYSCIVI